MTGLAAGGQAFSTLVTTPAWREDAVDWIHSVLASRGLRITGPIEQPRVRPWSTHLVIPTDVGTVWFKANNPSMAFESALHEALARLVPTHVASPLAVHAERGWLLTPDHGPTLADLTTGEATAVSSPLWCRVVTEAAQIQVAVVDHRDALLATGMTDASPASVPDRFDQLLDVVEPGLASQLRERRSELVDAVAALDASPFAATWQHGDLHPGNVFAGRESRPTVFDFGDSQWASALEILVVPFGWAHEHADVVWDEMVGAFLDVWGQPRREFDEAWNAVAFTHGVNRALTWHRALLTATSAELAEFGPLAERHLGRLLDA
jgi:hypothetical protein